MLKGVGSRIVTRSLTIRSTYRYFIKTSRTSTPPSDSYILLSMGDISDCLRDWRISTTVARCTSYPVASMSLPWLNGLTVAHWHMSPEIACVVGRSFRACA